LGDAEVGRGAPVEPALIDRLSGAAAKLRGARRFAAYPARAGFLTLPD
jgi:hypothetical protein